MNLEIQSALEANPLVGNLYKVVWLHGKTLTCAVFDTADFTTRITPIVRSTIIPLDDIILYLENRSNDLSCHKILWDNKIGYVYKAVKFIKI